MTFFIDFPKISDGTRQAKFLGKVRKRCSVGKVGQLRPSAAVSVN